MCAGSFSFKSRYVSDEELAAFNREIAESKAEQAERLATEAVDHLEDELVEASDADKETRVKQYA